jgi:hypothetical protein
MNYFIYITGLGPQVIYILFSYDFNSLFFYVLKRMLRDILPVLHGLLILIRTVVLAVVDVCKEGGPDFFTLY